jgi:hypothetical protein
LHGTEEEPLDEQVHVFVLKLWCEQQDTEAANCLWRGSLENALTRQIVYVNDLAELTAFLQHHIIDVDQEILDRALPSPHTTRNSL